MTSNIDERYSRIAENLEDRRVVSKKKARVIDTLELATCIQTVAISPDEDNRGAAVPTQGHLECAVCGLWKEHSYFKESQQCHPPDTRICRYCTWRIRTEVDRRYREIRGLDPPSVPRDPSFRDHSAEVSAFLKARRASPTTPVSVEAVGDPDHSDADGYYSPSFANLDSGWYLETRDDNYAVGRDAMLEWWNVECDVVVEWFLIRYGMFISAFDELIRKQITLHLHPNVKWARYYGYFIMTRVLTTHHLRALLTEDLNKRARKKHRCKICRASQGFIDIHPDRIKWTDGIVLPLCNDCWNVLERCLYPAVPRGVTPGEFAGDIDSVLGEKTCPVCDKRHSWRKHSYTYTDGFYSIPNRYREICFTCLDEAINQNTGDRSIGPNREALLNISQLIGGLPDRDMAKVVFMQSKTLDMAASVVRIMKEMWSFDRLASRHKKSWFAILVKSGCLPEGTRREHFGTRVLAIDGHECLSLGEMHIDNLLHRNKIKHRKEVRYPDSSYVCDWVLDVDGKEIFVEYFGLAGQGEYDEKMDAKRAIALRAGLEWVEFLPEDMKDLEAAFAAKILWLT